MLFLKYSCNDDLQFLGQYALKDYLFDTYNKLANTLATHTWQKSKLEVLL